MSLAKPRGRTLRPLPTTHVTPLRHARGLLLALADVAARVEQDRFRLPAVVGLDLGEPRVQVLPAGLGRGDQGIPADPPPRGHPRAHARELALVAEVGAPLPDRD